MRSDLKSLQVLMAEAEEALAQRDAQRAAEKGVTVDELYRIEAESIEAEKRLREAARRLSAKVAALEPFADRLGADVIAAALSETLEDTPAIMAVREFIDTGTRPFLVLSGGVGLGKTVAAVRALLTGRSEYVHAVDIARRYEPWSADKDVDRIDFAAQRMVIDDLGTERGDDPRFMEAFGQIVDQRIGPKLYRDGTMERRMTIITTNLRTLRERYGERTASRLAEHGTFVALSGDDMRRRTT